ncbi:MAG: hypothetical protein ACD_7C00181G0002 [uncultured bacterium]|nr:MAG: hypothetical protein ACD_7C00181G0002 [uncultured bacterium]
MANLSSGFSSAPDQGLHKYFKNLLISFKKEIQGGVDLDALQEKMQDLINASKEMKYPDNHPSNIFHIPETEKALSRLWKEFDRYIFTAQKSPGIANPQDLLEAIAIVESLLVENDIY